MPTPPAEPYREAMEEMRRRMGALDADLAREIQRALANFADSVRRGLSNLSPEQLRNAEATEFVVRRAAMDLEREIQRATEEGRRISFERTLALMEDAQRRALEAVGASALLGQVRTPPVSMLGAFESLGAPQTWKTLLRGHVQNAAVEANAIVRNALIEGVGPEELSRRLRRYVTGAEDFQDLFESVPTATGDVAKIDLRKLSGAQREAARKMEQNARRIAYTEMRAAREEADTQHFIRDPFVKAIRWELSPGRGTQTLPDACDVIARQDFYGLGPGVYPVSSVPVIPHPYCRCSRTAVTRPTSQIEEPKPSPSRRRSTEGVNVGAMPNGDKLTAKGADRAREGAESALSVGERAAAERGAA